MMIYLATKMENWENYNYDDDLPTNKNGELRKLSLWW